MGNITIAPPSAQPAEPAPPARPASARRSRIYAAHGLLPARNLRKHLRIAALSDTSFDEAGEEEVA